MIDDRRFKWANSDVNLLLGSGLVSLYPSSFLTSSISSATGMDAIISKTAGHPTSAKLTLTGSTTKA